MYKVFSQNHTKYGNVVCIEYDLIGDFESPFLAAQKAKYLKRVNFPLNEKVRFLVDKQVMNTSQLEKWANEEYKSLPKCQGCGTILNEQVYTHQLCHSGLFCSTNCSDKDFVFQMEKIEDEEEIEL